MSCEGGMRGIFINYRTGDNSHIVESLYRDLTRHFGADEVFLDVASIGGGARYPDVIRQHVDRCEVLLAVIHPQWLTAEDTRGVRLIDREGDWVRIEIGAALDAGKVVIPVLLGDTPAPLAADLPASIRDLAHRQAYRIRHGSQEADVRRLIGRLELDVAPTWTPPDTSSREPRRRHGRRLAVATAATAAVLLAVPPLLMLAHGDPLSAPGTPRTFLAAFWSVLFMSSIPTAVSVVRLFRVRINSLEREIHATPAARYNARLATPAIVVTALLTAFLVYTSSSAWFISLVIAAFLIVRVFGYGISALRDERNDDEEDANWPTAPPHPVSALAVRRAAARTRARLTSWRAPLSREQQAKAQWILLALRGAAEELREQADQPRLQWLTSKYAWQTSAGVLWAAGTMGLVLATVTPRIVSGAARFGVYATPVVAAMLIGGLFAGTVESVYRFQRWTRHRVAEEVVADITELRARLAEEHRS